MVIGVDAFPRLATCLSFTIMDFDFSPSNSRSFQPFPIYTIKTIKRQEQNLDSRVYAAAAYADTWPLLRYREK